MSAIVIKTKRTGCQVFIENDGLSAKLRVSGCSTGPLNRAEALTIADALTDGRLAAIVRAVREKLNEPRNPLHVAQTLKMVADAVEVFAGEFEP